MHPKPAGDGGAGLALENKLLSSVLWQHCVVAAQLSLWIRCTFECLQPNQVSLATSCSLSRMVYPNLERLSSRDRGSFTPVIETETVRDSNDYQ